MHRQINLAALHGGSDERRGLGGPAPRDDAQPRVGLHGNAPRVVGVNLDLQRGGGEPAEDFRFVRPRERVPLGTGAAAREQDERVFGVRLFGQLARWLEEEFGATVSVVEATVFEEPALAGRLR